MSIRSQAWLGALALAALLPAVADAQPRNPFAGLFDRVPAAASESTSVELRSTAGVQMGQTVRADFEQAEAVPEGFAAGADAAVVARHLRARYQIVGQGRYGYQEFRQTPAFGAPSFDAGARVNLQATTRLSFQGGGQFRRSPFYQMMWLSPEFASAPSSGPGAAILLMRNDSIEANAGFLGQLTRRSTVNAEAFVRETTFDSKVEHDFSVRGARGHWRRQLNRSFGLRLGYGREELRQIVDGVNDSYTNELLDVGVDFARGMSMGRRTTLSFATETSLVRENEGPRQFRLNGNIVLERRFLRTWVTQLSARRATEFVPGFRAPVFTERGRLGLAGYLNRRLLLNANGDGGRGDVGVGAARRFISYTGDTSLTLALTRHLGVFAQYAYYHYQMPPNSLALVTSPRLSRQAVSVGVKTWVPLIDKEKVPRDPR